MNWTEGTYGQIYSNELWEVNLLFVMYVKQIVIIIAHAARMAPYFEYILVIF